MLTSLLNEMKNQSQKKGRTDTAAMMIEDMGVRKWFISSYTGALIFHRRAWMMCLYILFRSDGIDKIKTIGLQRSQMQTVGLLKSRVSVGYSSRHELVQQKKAAGAKEPFSGGAFEENCDGWSY